MTTTALNNSLNSAGSVYSVVRKSHLKLAKNRHRFLHSEIFKTKKTKVFNLLKNKWLGFCTISLSLFKCRQSWPHWLLFPKDHIFNPLFPLLKHVFRWHLDRFDPEQIIMFCWNLWSPCQLDWSLSLKQTEDKPNIKNLRNSCKYIKDPIFT